jgi:flagellar hook protein FlgE
MSFNIALSGLRATTSDLDTISNNIANVATVGYKGSRTEFGDIFANSAFGAGDTAIGNGVLLNRVAQQFSQGSLSFTDNSLDLAISGQGFFVLEDENASMSYSRAGQFSVNKDGFVTNNQGLRLQTYPPRPNSDVDFQTGLMEDLRLPQSEGEPKATGTIGAGLNLNAQDSAAATQPFTFDPSDPRSYHHSSSTKIFDSLGRPHIETMYFRKLSLDDPAAVPPIVNVPPVTNDNTWDAHVYLDGVGAENEMIPAFQLDGVTPGVPGTTQRIVFNANGELQSVGANASPDSFSQYQAFNPQNGADPIEIKVEFDPNQTTQFGSDYSVTKMEQDGFPPGNLSGLDINAAGVVFASFSNGNVVPLGKVAMANFFNAQGLRQLGNTRWAETGDSGAAQSGEAGKGNFGDIRSGALENANVELTEQLVKLITAQRNYQANARAIETSSTITQTVINIR